MSPLGAATVAVLGLLAGTALSTIAHRPSYDDDVSPAWPRIGAWALLIVSSLLLLLATPTSSPRHLPTQRSPVVVATTHDPRPAVATPTRARPAAQPP